MRRFLIAASLLLVASCAVPKFADEAPQAAAPAVSTAPAVCRIAPNDGPVLAERGIGGTGLPGGMIPAAKGTTTSPPAGNNRGIGGTGLPAGTAVASSFTGIAGEVTGFASICVNGVEVQYGAGTPITVDGVQTSALVLRAGQIVAITAARQDKKLSAQGVEIRHEVVGPVSAKTWDGFIIAGQRVVREPGTRGQAVVAPGDWLAVSGLRNRADEIVATRIDRAGPGMVVLHGTLRGMPGEYSIGALPVQFSAGAGVFAAGARLTVTGTLQRGVLHVLSAETDLLYSDPPAYFGAETDHFLMEAYGIYGNGFVELADGTRAPAPLGRPARGPAIFSFTRGAAGGLTTQSAAAADSVNTPGGSWAGGAPPLLGPGQTGVPRPGQPNIGGAGMMPGMPSAPGFGGGGMPMGGFGGGGMGAPPH